MDEVNFNIKKNQFIGIIGPNGGGKTTLIKTIIGTLKPSKGQVRIDGNQVFGYVPQLTTFDRQFPITVLDVILIGHLPKKIKLLQRFDQNEKNHALSVMKQLGIENLSNRQIGKLSGGQMQRVLIARALMNHPTILILDEPTAGVDIDSRQEIYKMLTKLNKSMTIIMVTHEINDIIDRFDRIIYINKTVHIHNVMDNDEIIEGSFCPIDWFIEGNEKQKQLYNTKDEG